MSTNQKIIKSLNVQAAASFVQAIQRETPHYVFAAKHTPFTEGDSGGSDQVLPVPQDSVLTATQAYNDMIFGRRINKDNVVAMIKRYEWRENTVYDMYKDTESELYNKQFYVVVDDINELNVYKCLYNNNNAPSTQRPSIKDIAPFESPQDGYTWKYMYTVDQFNQRLFATADFVPVVPNANVISAAVDGAIEVVAVQEGGSGYNNYTDGRFPDAGSIAINNNFQEFGLANNASDDDGFYNDCIIKMVDGDAANEYRLITNYVIRNGRKVITLDSEFNNTPGLNSGYEIFPSVFIYDVYGDVTANSVARAIISSTTGNSISRVEVLSPGAGYRGASATIKTIAINNPTGNAVIVPIMSPPGGHGSNVENELFGHYVGISASFSGGRAPLTVANDYRTIGLLRSPQFSRVEVKLDSSNRRGNFIPGEEVFRYKPIKLFGRVSVTTGNTTVTGSNTEFIDTLRPNDRVIITDGITNILANVQTLASNTNMIISANSKFTNSNCAIYLVDALRFGTVVDRGNSTSVTLSNVDPVGEETGAYLLGESSGCTAEINTNIFPNIFIGGRDADGFSGFNQLPYFVGNKSVAVAFIEDELLVQGTDPLLRASARMHSYDAGEALNQDRLYVTNILNTFDVSGANNIVGALSSASFVPLDKYNGEIEPNSGDILYLENLNPITRNVSQTETIKLIIEF